MPTKGVISLIFTALLCLPSLTGGTAFLSRPVLWKRRRTRGEPAVSWIPFSPEIWPGLQLRLRETEDTRINTKVSAVSIPILGWVISRTTSGRFSASCSMDGHDQLLAPSGAGDQHLPTDST